jgi:hypothetical protein
MQQQRRESRRAGRQNCNAPAQLSWNEGNEAIWVQARTLDVSSTGARFEVAREVPRQAQIQFRAPGIALNGAGSVRFVERRGLRWTVGVQFAGGMKWKKASAETQNGGGAG